jgi:hypothetical protein
MLQCTPTSITIKKLKIGQIFRLHMQVEFSKSYMFHTYSTSILCCFIEHYNDSTRRLFLLSIEKITWNLKKLNTLTASIKTQLLDGEAVINKKPKFLTFFYSLFVSDCSSSSDTDTLWDLVCIWWHVINYWWTFERNRDNSCFTCNFWIGYLKEFATFSWPNLKLYH